jgi:tRNA threonylcarbamoyl adenosine modification protein YeaZ
MELVIDTATDACSVALIEDERVIAEAHEEIGRGHAEKLLPMIAELPGGGRADSILVDCGPGSFTGVRVGIAAARALALAWRADIAAYGSLALLAAMALARRPTLDKVAVAIPAGHGEVFLQQFSSAPFGESVPLQSLPPETAAKQVTAPLIVGRAAADLVALGAPGEAMDMLPRAAEVLDLPREFKRLPPHPIYGRPPDAKPMQ